MIKKLETNSEIATWRGKPSTMPEYYVEGLDGSGNKVICFSDDVGNIVVLEHGEFTEILGKISTTKIKRGITITGNVLQKGE